MLRSLRPLLLSIATLALPWALAGCGGNGAACSLDENDDGTFTLRCPDGSAGVLVPAEPGEDRCVVEGIASRIGLEDGSGIVVELLPANPERSLLRTFTDEAGVYRFPEVAPGTYRITFTHPAYATRVLEQVPVLPGTLRPDPMVLRPTRRLLSGPATTLLPSPSGTAVAIHDGPTAPLHLWEEVSQGLTRLARRASEPRWLPSGDALLYLSADEGSEAGSLIRYEVGSRRTTVIGTGVSDWAVSDDERAVVLVQAQGRLSVWHDGKRAVVSGSGMFHWSFAPQSKKLVVFERGRASTGIQVILWDVIAGTGSVLGRAGGLGASFDDRGISFLFQESGGVAVWDGDRERLVRFPPAFDGGALAPDGQSVLLDQRNLRLHLHDLRLGTTQELAHGSLRWWRFDPRTSTPMFAYDDGAQKVEAFYQGGHVSIVPRDATLRSPDEPLFPGDGGLVTYSALDPSGDRVLVAWDPPRGAWIAARKLMGSPELLAGARQVIFEGDGVSLFDGEEVQEVAAHGTLWPHYDSHPDGVVFLPLTPFYRHAPGLGELIAPLCVADSASGARHVIVDEIWHESCAFSPKGTLHCLSRRSPLPPHGAELLRWDRVSGQLQRLGDGILALHPLETGERLAFLTQPAAGSGTRLLQILEPTGGPAIPIDDGVDHVVGNERWILYSIQDGPRKGVYVSTYPRTPREGEAHEEG
jgi:hypothetical protein